MREDKTFLEVEVWDGDEYYATAYGPRDFVVSEAKHYARSIREYYSDDVVFMKVERTPITLEDLVGEVNEG